MRSFTNVLAVARRELGSYFSSPVGYVIMAFILFVNGLFFLPALSSQQASIRSVVSWITTLLVFFAPILSMRLLAEEARSGTLELLLTSPVRDGEVVVGKYLAALGFIGVLLALTLVYPAVLYIFGQPDSGEMVGGYVAMVLFGATAMAIGLLASSLTQNQIVAAVIGIATMIVLFWLDTISQSLGATGGVVGSVLTYLSLYPHLTELSRGVIDTKDVLYYVSIVAGALFLTTRSLEARRWRG